MKALERKTLTVLVLLASTLTAAPALAQVDLSGTCGWVTFCTQWKAVKARDFTAWVRDRLAPRLLSCPE